MRDLTLKSASAAVAPVEESTNPNGEFDVILSAQTLDRDGDILKSDEWKLPLPEHITFDLDHEMSVAGTVGSGTPFINEDGNLQVRGTFASTPRAQEVRTLVTEGHIRTTSVAFMTSKSTKGAKVERELLNGAFVAIPSNREAVVLSAKGIKAGARNSAADAKSIQAIHDAASGLGASCASDSDADGKSIRSTLVVGKAIAGSVEDLRDRISDALSDACSDGYPWIRATFLDEGGSSGTVVYELRGDTLARTFTDDGTATVLDDTVRDVSLITTIVDESVEPTTSTQSPDDSAPAAPDEKSAPAAPASSPEDVEQKRARELAVSLIRTSTGTTAQQGAE